MFLSLDTFLLLSMTEQIYKVIAYYNPILQNWNVWSINPVLDNDKHPKELLSELL